MPLCEPFLSGAPHAYFGARSSAPCTPVEERCTAQQFEHRICFLLGLFRDMLHSTKSKNFL